ncbi:MAG: hypothetical protein ACRD30_05075, partial [Bryobacteraceae bacterium]
RDSGDQKIHEQLAQLQQLVEQTNWILSSGLQLSDASAAVPEALDLEPLIDELVSNGRVAGDGPRVEIADRLPPVHADPDLARALIENLLALFRQISANAGPFTLRARATGNCVWIEFESNARGHRSEGSLGPGASLSLASARKLAEAHEGSIELWIDPESGLRLLVGLPRAVLP